MVYNLKIPLNASLLRTFYRNFLWDQNGPILSQLFRLGGNHEIWHKDAFKGGEFKLIRSLVKSDVRTISGGSMFFVHMFACRDENVRFFDLQVYCMKHHQKTRRMSNSRFPKCLSVKRNWTPKYGLIASARAHCTVFPGRSYLQHPLTLQR